MYFDMYGNCVYCGTSYCSSGYLLYTDYDQNNKIYYYRSDGIGNYYTESYCSAGSFYCFYYPYIYISQLNSCYPNGCIYIEHNGSGGYCTGLYSYCNDGFLFNCEDSLNYSCGYFSDGTGWYYTGIYEYCSSGFIFCTLDYQLNIPSYGLLKFGTFDIVANGSGNRFCSNFYYENSGTTLYTGCFPDCSICYISDGSGSYYTEINYCNSGYLFCVNPYYIEITNTGCFNNGSYEIVADGSGNRICRLLDVCSSGFLFDHIDLDFFRSLEIYSNGTGSFYTQTVIQSGTCIFQANDFITLPNDCSYLSSTYNVLISESGCIQCEDFVFTNSGIPYYSELIEASGIFSLNYFADGAGCYYFNTGFCESGSLIETGSYLIQLPNLNYYSSAITGLYSDGTGGYYSGFVSFCEIFYVFYACEYENCYSCYTSDTSGGYLNFNGYCDSGKLFCTGSYSIQLPNLNYYDNGITGLYADGVGGRFLSGYSYCALGYRFLCSGDFAYTSDGTGSFYSEVLLQSKLHKLCIEWDFDAQTKCKYFHPLINLTEQTYSIPIKNDSYCFYEINAINNASIYFCEPSSNCSLFLNSTKPFVYLRNVGTGCLFLNSSCSGNSGCYWSFNENRLSGVTQSSGLNYLINPKEGLFVSLNVSVDGSKYFSASCYPFAFFYEATNIEEVNTGLCYPVKENGIYELICNYPSSTDYDYSYNQLKTFQMNSFVDDCSSFRIKFQKTGCDLNVIDCFNKNFTINSCFGNSKATSNINVNYFLINGAECFICCDNFIDPCFDFTVFSDCCLTVYYNIDSCTSKTKKYFYYYSGSGSGGLNNLIFENSKSGLLNLNQNNLENTCLYSFEVCNENYIFACIESCENFSIVDICTESVNTSGVFLPTKENWCYCYCFNLFESDVNFATGKSGAWIDINEQFQNNFSINYINTLNSSDPCYLSYCPDMYCIQLNYNDNRYSTTGIEIKNENSKSEFFILNPFCECCLFYKGLEFRYLSYNSLFYGNECYPIDDICIPIVFSGCCCSVTIDYPVRALSQDKLKIITDYETIDRVNCIYLNLNYPFLNFNFYCSLSNYSCFVFPKIYSSCNNDYISPNVDLQINSNLSIQKNIKFYFNTFGNYLSDNNYGLNNLLLFVNSEVNGGAANCVSISGQYYFCKDFYCLFNQVSGQSGYYACDDSIGFEGYFDCRDYLINYMSGGYSDLGYSINIQYENSNPLCCITTGYAELSGYCVNDGYEYQASDYNFLFLDLENEFCVNDYLICNTGFLFKEYSTTNEYCTNSLIPYKSISGEGYNYIFPIFSNLIYSDCFNSCVSGVCCVQIQKNENLNFSRTGSYYWGGYSGGFDLTGSEGQVTGYQELLSCCSNFISYNNIYNIKFDSSDISNTISGRCLNISKEFKYTGLQPLCIVSNYPLLDIRDPILNCKLLKYSCEPKDSCFCEIFYYSYDITKTNQSPIRFIAPESTLINCICWKDEIDQKNISIFEQNKQLGSIQKNVSQINFCITGLFLNNQMLFQSCNTCYVCINIIGDL